MKTFDLAGKIARFFINSKLTPVLIAAICAFGLLAIVETPRQENPQITMPAAIIVTQYPGADRRRSAEAGHRARRTRSPRSAGHRAHLLDIAAERLDSHRPLSRRRRSHQIVRRAVRSSVRASRGSAAGRGTAANHAALRRRHSDCRVDAARSELRPRRARCRRGTFDHRRFSPSTACRRSRHTAAGRARSTSRSIPYVGRVRASPRAIARALGAADAFRRVAASWAVRGKLRSTPARR